MMTFTTHVTYLFDPLCGWCYGASAALEHVAADPTFTVMLAPTGLFAGENARPMDEHLADFAWTSDQRIARMTGQRFSEEYRRNVLGNRTSMLDSAPATRALTAVHLTAPEREFHALKAIQQARYVEGRDNTDVSVIALVLSSLRLDAAVARLLSADAELLAANERRLEAAGAQMRQFNVSGVPAVIVGEGHTRRLLRSSALYGSPLLLHAALKAA